MSRIKPEFLAWGVERFGDFYVTKDKIVGFLEFASRTGARITGMDGITFVGTEKKIRPNIEEIFCGDDEKDLAESNRNLARFLRDEIEAGHVISDAFAVSSEEIWTNETE